MGVKDCCIFFEGGILIKAHKAFCTNSYASLDSLSIILRHVDQTAQILAILIVQVGQVGVIARFHVVAVTKPKLEIALIKLFLDRLPVRFQIRSLVQPNHAKIVLPTAQTGHHGVTVQFLVAQDTEHVTDIAQAM